MRFIWVVNGKKIKGVLLILIAAFFAALVAFIQNQEVSVFSTTKGPMALSKVVTDQKNIALTFDINWGDQQINLILKTLKAEHIKATFFFSGEWADRHKDIVEQAKKDGHEIESQGMNHKAYTDLETSDVRKDILLSNEAIYKASGERPHFVRPPFGKINQNILQTAAALHQQVVLWRVNPQDETNPGYQKIVSRVIKKTQKGDIIKLHASDSAKQTYKALPLIIRELKDKGYTFVTMTSLVSDAKVKNRIIN